MIAKSAEHAWTLVPEHRDADQSGWITAQLTAWMADRDEQGVISHAPGFSDPEAVRLGRQFRRCIGARCLDPTTVRSAVDLIVHASGHAPDGLPAWAKRGFAALLRAESWDGSHRPDGSPPVAWMATRWAEHLGWLSQAFAHPRPFTCAQVREAARRDPDGYVAPPDLEDVADPQYARLLGMGYFGQTGVDHGGYMLRAGGLGHMKIRKWHLIAS